jgi:hypothetical protein
MTDGFDYYVKKNVYVILKNKRVYAGVVDSIENSGNGLVFIYLIDKFGNRVVFTSGEIEVLEEKR